MPKLKVSRADKAKKNAVTRVVCEVEVKMVQADKNPKKRKLTIVPRPGTASPKKLMKVIFKKLKETDHGRLLHETTRWKPRWTCS